MAWNSTTCADISRKFIFIPLLTTSHHKWSHMLCSTIHITYVHMSCDGSEITMFGGPHVWDQKSERICRTVFVHCHFTTINLNDMDFVRTYLGKNEPLTSWTLFPHFLTGFTTNQSKNKKIVFNWLEVHLYRSNFLQNPYIVQIW